MGRHPLLRLGVIATTLLAAGFARASASFPLDVQQHWQLAKLPECTLCHSDLTGGTGTVVTYFGLSMQDFGAVKTDKNRLEDALDQDAALDWDSDGDGIPDMKELVSGGDPNDGPGPKFARFPPPQHGCAASPRRPGSDMRGAMVIAAVGLLGVLLAARRRDRFTQSSPFRRESAIKMGRRLPALSSRHARMRAPET